MCATETRAYIHYGSEQGSESDTAKDTALASSGNQQGVWLWSLGISTLWLWSLGSSSFFKQLKISFLDFDFKAKVFDLPQALAGLFFRGRCLSHLADTFGTSDKLIVMTFSV